MSKHGATSFLQLLRERRTRDAIYGAADYWDTRTGERSGLSRSLWPSNVYNEVWDERQRDIVDRAADVSGKRVVDIGCGTGRMTRFFAGRGAKEAVGIDFSEKVVQAATEESNGTANVRFVQGDVVAGLDHVGRNFDLAVVLGCFSVACRDPGALDRAFENVSHLLAKGGRLLIFEPIHRSPLLRRVLDLGVEDWIASANRADLRVVAHDRMGFVPVRLVFSVRDLPRGLVSAVFTAGERILDAAPYLPLADYTLLVFEHGSAR